MALRLRRRLKREAPDLNITAFLNLMVILVPFLLITAVFSRMTILELNIPPQSADPNQPQNNKEFQLVVTVRNDGIEIGDSIGGIIKRFDKSGADYDYNAFSKLLQQIKVRFPEKKNASILLEPNISYDTLVQVMDKLRVVEQVQFGAVVKAELFPDISIGDAPVTAINK